MKQELQTIALLLKNDSKVTRAYKCKNGWIIRRNWQDLASFGSNNVFEWYVPLIFIGMMLFIIPAAFQISYYPFIGFVVGLTVLAFFYHRFPSHCFVGGEAKLLFPIESIKFHRLCTHSYQEEKMKEFTKTPLGKAYEDFLLEEKNRERDLLKMLDA